MAKPLDQFGGWLKFFFVVEWISIVLGSIFSVAFIAGIVTMEGMADKGYNLLYLIDTVIMVFISMKIVRIIKIKEQTVPQRIIKFLFIYAGATLAITAIQFIILYQFPMKDVVVDKEAVDLGKATIKALVWIAFWANYFKKSKRAITYYGLLSNPA